MEQNPSWEANIHSTSQEIPCLLSNPKVHYCVHKSLLHTPCVKFWDKQVFYGKELLSFCPTPILEDHSKSKISHTLLKGNIWMTISSSYYGYIKI